MAARGSSPASCCPTAYDNRRSREDGSNGSSNDDDNNDHDGADFRLRVDCWSCLQLSQSTQPEWPPQSRARVMLPRCNHTDISLKPRSTLNAPSTIQPEPPSPLKPNWCTDYNRNSKSPAKIAASSLLLEYCFTILIIATLVKPSLTSVNTYQNAPTTQPNKNSGQFHISQLCSQRSPFPITRRVEGATLASGPTDTDMNCTITFRTKSAQQHFVIRFEELKLSCNDHLILFDGDLDYGQPSIKDFSCRDNMASTPILKTTGTFLTMRYSSDGHGKLADGFRLVVTAAFDISVTDCPPEYVFCRSQLCISRSLFCDGVNHCLDNSDEIGCNGPDDIIDLNYVLGFFVMLILIIATGVCVCVVLHCRRDQSPYTQYQHHLQRALGVPLQTSSSLMFTHQQQQQPQYQFFQPANVSPYMTPHHLPAVGGANAQQQAAAAAMFATLPRNYSTLPLNLVRGHPQQAQTILAAKLTNANDLNMMANHHQPPREYVMMAGLGGPHLIQPGPFALGPMQPTPVSAGGVQQPQHTQNLTSSQSILSTSTSNAAGPANSAINRLQQRHMTSTPPTSNSAAQVTTSNGTLRERTGSGL